jgi:hypothetical protein
MSETAFVEGILGSTLEGVLPEDPADKPRHTHFLRRLDHDTTKDLGEHILGLFLLLVSLVVGLLLLVAFGMAIAGVFIDATR